MCRKKFRFTTVNLSVTDSELLSRPSSDNPVFWILVGQIFFSSVRQPSSVPWLLSRDPAVVAMVHISPAEWLDLLSAAVYGTSTAQSGPTSGLQGSNVSAAGLFRVLVEDGREDDAAAVGDSWRILAKRGRPCSSDIVFPRVGKIWWRVE